MRRIVPALISAIVVSLISAAAAASAQAAEWLYVLASKNIQVIPGEGDDGRVVLRPTIKALQFTDRPDRQSSAATVRSVLQDFGWTPASSQLTGKVPNAAVVIEGDVTQTVEIRRAVVGKKATVLYVRGLDGPLKRDSGPGAVFIDDAAAEFTTQISSTTLAVVNCNSTSTSATVTLEVSGITVWSGTTTVSAPEVAVPSTTEGGTTISGSVSTLFTASDGPATATPRFSGTVTESGSTSPVVGLDLGNCSAG